MKKIKRLVLIFGLVMFYLMIGRTLSDASYQKLNSLDFQVYIQNDGSMQVTENWDVRISETNTLFKNFKKDKNKFSNITDVKITDITEGKKLTKINTEMYHVTKDCYYGLDIANNKFEIAWGVGLDNTSAVKQYKIEYTVEDAVAKYNDCAELYWQFVGDNFEIDAKKITGTIYLPSNANNKEEIKVWGHTKELNGEIYSTDLNKVEFNINDFNSGNYVEVRIAMPTELILISGRTYNQNRLQSILNEEEKWVEEANNIRKRNEAIKIMANTIFCTIIIIIDILLLSKIKKYKSIINRDVIIKPTQEIKYFREFPREDASPTEAKFLLDKYKFELYSTEIGNVFSAIILNLYNLGYIEIQENEKNNPKFILKAKEEEINNIKNEDEKLVYKYLEKVLGKKEEFTLKDLQKYITSHSSSILKLQTELTESAKRKLYRKEYINKSKEKEYMKYYNTIVGYIIGIITFSIFSIPICIIILNNMVAMLLISIMIIIMIICSINLSKAKSSINVYSQEAIDEIEMWNGLKRFMEEFSQLDKKEIPEVVLWEKYLVYATAFGIADKVLKQLKIVYSNYEEQLGINTSTHMNLILSSHINNTISNSINKSISSVYSSGSGGGGGFSGGGRRRRRPVVEVAEDSHYQ